MTMSKEQFAQRWDSDDDGGGINFDDIADCAVAWVIYAVPRIHPIHDVKDAVVTASGATT